LLAGSYRVLLAVDGQTYAYALSVRERPGMGEIVRADRGGARTSGAPFVFDGQQIDLASAGSLAIVPVARPGKIDWKIRKGLQIVWKGTTDAQQVATLRLPAENLPPGSYKLEAASEDESRSIDLVLGQTNKETTSTSTAKLVSFNANLSPALRLAAIGHQYILEGKPIEARRSLTNSLNKGYSNEAEIELARLDALEGKWDAARDRVRIVLAGQPRNFEALAVFAYVETQFQDYEVAAQLYRRALAVEDSPEVRMALAHLPRQ
jgi:hypothetical protein